MTPIFDGRGTVTGAGTAVQLNGGTSVGCNSLTITAEGDNAGTIVVGGSSVVAAIATRRGTPLGPGDTKDFDRGEVDDVTQVWIDATNAGEGVTFTYTQ